MCDMRQASLWEQLRLGRKSLSLVVAGISPYQHCGVEECSPHSGSAHSNSKVIGEGATATATGPGFLD